MNARPVHLAEPFAGTLAVARHFLAPRQLGLVNYMGCKGASTKNVTSLAGRIIEAMGFRPGQGLASLLAVDAGPWGWIWPVLMDPAAVAEVLGLLQAWSSRPYVEVWEDIAAGPPSTRLVTLVAQYLVLQGRSANGIPVWPEMAEGCWLASDGRGSPRPPGQRGGRWVQAGGPGRAPQRPGQRSQWRRARHRAGCSGLTSISTIVERLEAVHEQLQGGAWVMAGDPWPGSPKSKAIQQTGRQYGVRELASICERITGLSRLSWPPVDIYAGPVQEVSPEEWADARRGSGVLAVYLDPPYVPPPGGRPVTRYGMSDPGFEELLEVILRWAAVADVVAVSHNADLSAHLGKGWRTFDLSPWARGRKAETLTLNMELLQGQALQEAVSCAWPAEAVLADRVQRRAQHASLEARYRLEGEPVEGFVTASGLMQLPASVRQQLDGPTLLTFGHLDDGGLVAVPEAVLQRWIRESEE